MWVFCKSDSVKQKEQVFSCKIDRKFRRTDVDAFISAGEQFCKIEKGSPFTHFSSKNTHISRCKIVHFCTIATVTVHICTVTVALSFIILLVFSLSFSLYFWLLSLSLSPHSHCLRSSENATHASTKNAIHSSTENTTSKNFFQNQVKQEISITQDLFSCREKHRETRNKEN